MTTWQDRALMAKYAELIENWADADRDFVLMEMLENLIREARETKEQ